VAYIGEHRKTIARRRLQKVISNYFVRRFRDTDPSPSDSVNDGALNVRARRRITASTAHYQRGFGLQSACSFAFGE
jgi:hypothetical protein